MAQQNITLISFGYFEKEVLEEVAGAVRLEFRMPVIHREGRLDLSGFFDAARRQYNGNLLLKEVDAMSMAVNGKTIGLFNVDLFIPILTYIFGQAALGGRAGLASIYRLNNQLYGLPADRQLMQDRFVKEVIHELGHTFGLIHCNSPVCVMRSSTYIEDIDLKERHLCDKCREVVWELSVR
jgi:archaemetzincin